MHIILCMQKPLCVHTQDHAYNLLSPASAASGGDDDSPLSGGDDKNLTEFCLGKGTSKDV